MWQSICQIQFNRAGIILLQTHTHIQKLSMQCFTYYEVSKRGYVGNLGLL